MIWLIVDHENYFDIEREDYSIKKGSKGISNADKIKEHDFLLIYNASASKRRIEQIYVVTEEVYPTDREEYPVCIGISFIYEIDNPISFEEMKQFNPKSKYKKRPNDKSYVDDPSHRAIGKITTNNWGALRNRLLEDHRLSELIRLFKE